jgi:hypothetical protein
MIKVIPDRATGAEIDCHEKNQEDLNIQFGDKILPTKSEKHRFLIQKLPVEFGD